jgi:glycosyltransferase involved in cell wall biosynthesis
MRLPGSDARCGTAVLRDGAAVIVVNGRFMTQRLTGVQRYARGITRELLAMRDDVEVVVPRKAHVRDEYLDLPFTRIGALTGHAWEQISLPRYTTKDARLLLNLGSTGPALLSRQVVTNHDITYVRHPESFALAFRVLYRAITPVLLRRASRIITVSEFSKREIAAFFRVPESKFVVVPNSADATFTPGSSRTGDPYLLAVSSPSSHKNFGRLLDAYAKVDPESRPRLVIAGGTAPALVRPDLAQHESVEFVGRVGDDELLDLYRGASAFIFPSLYEGFGIPPLEAQACGVPVLAADIPSSREVLLDSARYFNPMSVSDITRAIHEAAHFTATQRDEIVASGLQNADRFSWGRSAQDISAVLDDLLTARTKNPVGSR